ncbi:MAG: pantoate--beta-alanine ligase [Planctomycetota bacterium]
MIERLGKVADARSWCTAARARGSLGFVATMGALHQGHLELVRRATRENRAVAVSVFVNPLQFEDPADLQRYPRDFEGDAAILAEAGCQMVFSGTLEEFFPGALDGSDRLPDSLLRDPGPTAKGLEGEFRPGHFAGVATIVDALFDVVRPARAYFGAKDFQQCLVVTDLAAKRGGPRIVVCPTVREPSGLALSSRNRLLDDEGRERGPALFRACRAAREHWRAGERDAAALSEVMRSVLAGPGLAIEYAEVRDPEAWSAERPSEPLQRGVALVAATLQAVRLIDNLSLSGPGHVAE